MESGSAIDDVQVSQWVRRGYGYALLLVAATLPYLKPNSLSVILLVLFWFLERNFSEKWRLFRRRPLVGLFVWFYVLFALGILYTEDVRAGFFNLEKKLTLLALPIAIGTSLVYNRALRDRALMAFVVSITLSAFVCMAYGLWQWQKHGDFTALLHENLSRPVNFHPPFFGMYVCFVILTTAYFITDAKRRLAMAYRLGGWSLILFMTFFVLLLSARTAMLFLILFFVTAGVHWLRQNSRLLVGGAAFALIALVSVLIVSKSPYLQERFYRPIIADITITEGGGETGLSIRLIKWKCSLNGFMENPAFGVGTGDALGYLVQCYQSVNFWGMYPQYRFNAHNQFLETMLTLGAVGLLSFLLPIFWLMRQSWRHRNYLAVSFVALFCVCCITESVLERQWGVVFFTLFSSLFAFQGNQNAAGL